MDELAVKVSIFVCDVKKAILPRFYAKLQSAGGHNCMRTYGPIIAVCFYLSQALHAFLFFMVFGPALHEKFPKHPLLAYLLQLVGWLFCFKVTYLYYRVNTSSAGSPSDVLTQKKKRGVARSGDDPSY